MEPTFDVTAAASQVVLKEVPAKGGKGPASFAGQAAFTVTNTTGAPVTGQASILPEGTAPKQLFSIADSRLEVPGKGTAQLTVDVAAPTGTPAGTYAFRALVANAANPDEDSTPSPSVSCVVPASKAPKKPFPWWILIVAAVVLIGGFLVFKLLSHKKPETKSFPMPPVTNLSPDAAVALLTQASLKVSVTFVPALVSTSTVAAENPAVGVAVVAGQQVSITVNEAPLPGAAGQPFFEDGPLKLDLDPPGSAGDVDVVFDVFGQNILPTTGKILISPAQSDDPSQCDVRRMSSHGWEMGSEALFCVMTDNGNISVVFVQTFLPPTGGEFPTNGHVDGMYSTWKPGRTENH